MTKSRGILGKRKLWTSDEVALMAALFPTTRTETLAQLFECEMHQVHSLASKKMKLQKSEWYMKSTLSGRMVKGANSDNGHRFAKGHVPANKGMKGMPSHPNAVHTQFKPGTRPHNWVPVGTTRFGHGGYMLIKMAEGKLQWKPLHPIIWERLNGPIPDGYVLRFIDGNALNCKVTNLSLYTKRDHFQLLSVHSHGPEIAELYQIKGRITRQINKRSSNP